MKALIIILQILIICSGCYTQKNLGKRNEPLTEDVICKIKTGKTYWLNHKSGVLIKLRVNSIDSTSLYGNALFCNSQRVRTGRSAFLITHKELIERTEEIYVIKFNLYATFIPITVLGLGLLKFSQEY